MLAASLAIWLLTPPLRAQKLTQRVESRLGLGSVSMREDLLVPYAFTGPALAFEAGYGSMKGPHGLDLILDFGMAPAWTKAGDPGIHARYALGAAYYGVIHARSRRSSWLGAFARFSHELAELLSWDDAHGYWLDALMFGPALRHAEQPWPLVGAPAARPDPRRSHRSGQQQERDHARATLDHALRHRLRQRRVVSAEWASQSTQTHVEAGEAGTGHTQLGFGYYWWTVNGQTVYSAWGHSGQHILISPKDELVVVKIALPDTDNLEGGSLEDFLDLISPLLG